MDLLAYTKIHSSNSVNYYGPDFVVPSISREFNANYPNS